MRATLRCSVSSEWTAAMQRMFDSNSQMRNECRVASDDGVREALQSSWKPKLTVPLLTINRESLR